MDTECCLGIPKCSETAFSTRVATSGGEQRRGVSHQLTSSVRGHCPVDYRWPLYGGRQPESLVYDVVLNLRVAFTLSLPTRSSSPSASAPILTPAHCFRSMSSRVLQENLSAHPFPHSNTAATCSDAAGYSEAYSVPRPPFAHTLTQPRVSHLCIRRRGKCGC